MGETPYPRSRPIGHSGGRSRASPDRPGRRSPSARMIGEPAAGAVEIGPVAGALGGGAGFLRKGAGAGAGAIVVELPERLGEGELDFPRVRRIVEPEGAVEQGGRRLRPAARELELAEAEEQLGVLGVRGAPRLVPQPARGAPAGGARRRAGRGAPGRGRGR